MDLSRLSDCESGVAGDKTFLGRILDEQCWSFFCFWSRLNQSAENRNAPSLLMTASLARPEQQPVSTTLEEGGKTCHRRQLGSNPYVPDPLLLLFLLFFSSLCPLSFHNAASLLRLDAQHRLRDLVVEGVAMVPRVSRESKTWCGVKRYGLNSGGSGPLSGLPLLKTNGCRDAVKMVW